MSRHATSFDVPAPPPVRVCYSSPLLTFFNKYLGPILIGVIAAVVSVSLFRHELESGDANWLFLFGIAAGWPVLTLFGFWSTSGFRTVEREGDRLLIRGWGRTSSIPL